MSNCSIERNSLRGVYRSRAVLCIIVTSLFATATCADDGVFDQNEWSGGASPAVATHSTHQTGWTQYRAKDPGIAVVNAGGDLTITGESASVEHTTAGDFAAAPDQVLHTNDEDFAAGTLTNVEISAGSIRLVAGQATGTYISPVIDTGTHLGYRRIFFSMSRPAGTRITRQGETNSFMMLGVRTSANGVTWSQWVGYASSYFLLPEGNRRYIQYKAQFDTTDPAVTPELHDVAITFVNYPQVNDVDVVCTGGTPCEGHMQLAANSNSGTYLSSIIDLAKPRQLLTADFDRFVPVGASASVLVRGGSSGNPDFDSSAWGAWLPVAASGDDISALGTVQYLQYKVELTRSGNESPTVERVRINYVGDPVPGAQVALISSSFNTDAADGLISSIEWIESLPANTDVRIQVATAADQHTLENSAIFVGPDGTGGSWWNSANSPSNGGCFKPGNATVVACSVVPPALRNGSDDRWFAYKVTLVASNSLTPVAPSVSRIAIHYASGAEPSVVVAPTSGLTTTEGGETAVFGVVLNTAPVNPVTISLTIDRPDEIMLSTPTVTFDSTNWSEVQLVTVTGKDDAVLDGDQPVTISTSIAAGSDSGYAGLGVADVSVTNADNDRLTATIEAADVNGAETGADTAAFRIVLNSVAVAPLQIGFVLGGSAAEGADYTVSATSSVTIAAGTDSATIIVTPIDDADVEGQETVTAVLFVGTGYAVKTPNSASVVIFDNEETPLPTLTVTSGSTSARESDLQPGLFTISRTGALGAPLAVTYTVAGNAIAGRDYVALSGVAVIPGSSANVVVAVTPLDDTAAEDAETVVLSLAPDAAYMEGDPASASVAITDNDQSVPVVTIAMTSPVDFVISRTGDTSSALPVLFAVSGTATAITDYQPLGGSVVIPAGSSSATMHVAPREDATLVGSKTVIVTLAAAPGYTIGSSGSATATITRGAAAESGDAGGSGGAAHPLELVLAAFVALFLVHGTSRAPGRSRP